MRKLTIRSLPRWFVAFEIIVSLPVPLLLLSALSLFHLEPVLAGDKSDHGSPAWIEVEPNAIQDLDRPMAIKVGGIPQGDRVRLQVLQDCNGDGEPELESQDRCRNPLDEWESPPANYQNVVSDRLDFRALGAKGRALPTNKPLWLRAYRPGSRQARQVIFGLVRDEACSLWQKVVDTFFGGKCDSHLPQALRQHRSSSDLEHVTFEVRLLELDVEGETDEKVAFPVPVADTRGATGVAWLDQETLVVTIASTATPGGESQPGEAIAESKKPPPGLYRVSIAGGELKRLWSPAPEDSWHLVAPLPLADGRIVVVRQRLGEPADGKPASYLSIWHRGDLDEGIPLPYKIHQLVASDDHGSSILALTLGIANSRPGFLEIRLESREVKLVGYHHGLYHAAMRSPKGGFSVISAEDNSKRFGWFLVVVDERGQWVKDLQVRSGHDLLPAWRPNGGMVAYLAEVDRIGPPAWLEIEPSTIQDPNRPMIIKVGGVPQGTSVIVQVLQDCDGDGEPEAESYSQCLNPLVEFKSVEANSQNIAFGRLDFQALEAEGMPLPRNAPLWLRVYRPGSRQARQAIFGLVVECSLWQSVVHTFFGGECDSNPLQALRQHR